MGKRTNRGDTVRGYCELYPHLADHTLARLIFKEYGHLWEGTKDRATTAIRLSVRYHRGKKVGGAGNYTQQPIDSSAVSSHVRSDYRAPATKHKSRDPYVVHGAQRVLCLSDVHFPIHDPVALDAALHYGLGFDPTIVLLNGDILDLHDFSRHEKTTLDSWVSSEIEMLVGLLDALRGIFPKARILYKEGNHEERLHRYLLSKAPELGAVKKKQELGEDAELLFDLPGFVRFLSDRPDAFLRVEWIADKRPIRIGHLQFVHGHEYKGGGGVTPARWLMLRTRESAVCGHFHRRDEHSGRTLSGKSIGTWSTGCLCGLSPDYLPFNEWTQGFITAEIAQDGSFSVRNLRIIDGSVV